MKLTDYLKIEQVIPNLDGSTKNEGLKSIAESLARSPNSLEIGQSTIYDALLEREDLGSTGIGDGIAIPHAKLPQISSMVACFAKSDSGIDFDAIDNQPVNLVFALLVPENSAGLHLKALARISRLLKSSDFRASLLSLQDAGEIYTAFQQFDEGD